MKQNWTQFTYRVRIDELGPYPKRLNLKGARGGQKGPKVHWTPRVAGFAPFGSKYGPNIRKESE